MDAIRTYTNTKCELEMAKARLDLLMDRKEQLYCKYFPITARIKDEMITGGERKNDKMDRYLYELYDVDIGTGKSLAGEIDYQREVINRLQRCLADMSEALGRMDGIEYALYYEIVVNGTRISRAVQDIAEEYGKDVKTIWKYHYSKIKKDIKILAKYSESTVNPMLNCKL